jgi:hypothetical protein
LWSYTHHKALPKYKKEEIQYRIHDENIKKRQKKIVKRKQEEEIKHGIKK